MGEVDCSTPDPGQKRETRWHDFWMCLHWLRTREWGARSRGNCGAFVAVTGGPLAHGFGCHPQARHCMCVCVCVGGGGGGGG
jgi:hypothetical protein